MKEREKAKHKKENSMEENNSQQNKQEKIEENNKKVTKPKSLEEKYTDALFAIEELQKKRMYLQAEMENSQKIALKRIENSRYNIKVSVISNFLPIVDSFEAAISKYETTAKKDYEQLLDGLKSLQKQFLQVLKGLGIKPIEEINVPFNYKEHDVFMKLVDEQHPEDTVINIAQKGYYLGENVLRPAKVIVSKKKESPQSIPVEATILEESEQTSSDNNSSSDQADKLDEKKEKP
ncbi:MAG: nucleotide exchange factor GrpE [Candidatus Lokiarchaeota archaeon]|nr:nucleotide exchange factor GrpE [Candidatus Lokiarchaeota archaeon]